MIMQFWNLSRAQRGVPAISHAAARSLRRLGFFAENHRFVQSGRSIAGFLSSLLLICFALGGCGHSHVIQVTVTNTSNEKISNIVINYPEATFGINILGPGKSFQYKIKPTATGALKIEFLNSHAADRVSA